MSSSLRVLHVISSMSRLRGGPSVVVHNMLKALSRRGVAVEAVATDDDGGTARLDVPLDRFVDFDGQRVRFFPRQSLKYAFSAPMRSWLRANIRGYDIVHTHELFTFAPLCAARLAKAARIPYVMTPHGALDSWGMQNKSRLVKAASVRLVEGPLLASAAGVNFMTPLEHARASGHGLSFRPLVLPVGVVEPDEPQTSTTERLDPSIGSIAGRVLLFLARIHPIKCVDVLLKAFAGLEDRESVLVIAGGGDEALVDSLRRLAGELGIGGRVKWLGFTGGAEKRWLLSRATLFVLPSASENYGIAAVEAMLAGLPVIVTAGCGLADFVTRHGAGIVTDGSVAELRSALAALLASAELAYGMGEAGRRAARRELSLDTFGERLETSYRRLLHGEASSMHAASHAV
ncbi:MAG TPA: glycosyltransferase [Steroidobacteraceae bacterium]|nr:glycosyltransferase [Steroidobacteraceae bacterium]